jgi:hypothetical protein
MSKKEININPNLVLAIGGLVLVFFAGRAILKKLGIVQSQQDKREEKELNDAMKELSSSDYFDPDYWRKGGAGTLLIKNDTANLLAERLYNAKGIFNDNESAVYGVFQLLKTRSQVSYLAMIFYQKYNKSMLTYLLEFLNDQEMLTVAKITNKLPNYKP